MNIYSYLKFGNSYQIQDNLWAGSSAAFNTSSILFISIFQLWDKINYKLNSKYTYSILLYIWIININDTTNIDLNPKDDAGSNTSTDTLTDYNDWANITIVFNETYSGQTRSLRNFSESNYNNEVFLHPIYDHLQPVAEEFDPPKSFFEELNRNLRLND